MRLPNFQSLGTCTNSSIHIASNNLYKISTIVLVSAFRALGGMWSDLAAQFSILQMFDCSPYFLFVWSLTATVHVISRSTLAGKISGVVLGAGLQYMYLNVKVL